MLPHVRSVQESRRARLLGSRRRRGRSGLGAGLRRLWLDGRLAERDLYEALADAYPDAKVILTERDPEAWWASTQATIFNWDTAGERIPEQFRRMLDKVIGALFDHRIHDRDHVMDVFKRHNARVREVIAPDRLLVYEVADGWAPLCAFLGVPVPDGPMPKVNTTEEFQARQSQSRAES